MADIFIKIIIVAFFMVGKEAIGKGKKREHVEAIERKKATLNETIQSLEEEIANTKYNKRTQHAIGLMKAKLAMLKQRAEQRISAGKGRGEEYSIRKTGDGTVVILGFPSVGKSTLLNALTNSKSDVGAYDFTTLRAVPGVLKYKFAKIQIIDVPGIVSGAASGRGRGKEVLGVLRSADLILILIDALNPQHYNAILKEVYESGIRINSVKPYIKIMKKERGGVNVGTTVKLTKLDINTIKDIAREMRINNADILFRSDVSADEFIDVIEGNKKYVKSLVVVNKIDLIDYNRLREIKDMIKPDVLVSGELGTGIEELKEVVYTKMNFIRVFLKEVNKQPDMEEPLIMFKGCNIKDVCLKLHKDFVEKFKYARVWGKSAKFDGQVFRRLDKVLEDSDILEIHIK